MKKKTPTSPRVDLEKFLEALHGPNVCHCEIVYTSEVKGYGRDAIHLVCGKTIVREIDYLK